MRTCNVHVHISEDLVAGGGVGVDVRLAPLPSQNEGLRLHLRKYSPELVKYLARALHQHKGMHG